ncbi:MAG: MFS transporter [Verrucomicrobia bacterium]|nr:MFS transporter [Verrucomicrobiota bacterium]
MILPELRALSAQQRNAVLAAFLGWTLDAFDFFLFVFIIPEIAAEFLPKAPDGATQVGLAVNLTLVMRPVGALLFGLLADRFGRRPTLTIDILCYSVLAFLSGFSPNLTTLLVLRALFGVAMGGEWGVGASLALETIPEKSRGFVSGLLQAGYPTGYLLASLATALVAKQIGWRGLLFLGLIPAFLVLFLRQRVDESPAWKEEQPTMIGAWKAILRHWPLFLFAIAMMTCFNFFSHGTQDVYPLFLKEEHHLDLATRGAIGIVFNIGAIIGGVVFGTWSERIGRRRAIVIAALLALPVIPFWAFAQGPVLLAAGAFMMQFCVQAAWGVVPAHLNELSPAQVRGTFPGFAYQLGNLLASWNYTIEAGLGDHFNKNYGLAIAIVTAVVAVCVALIAGFGPEAKGVRFVRGSEARPARVT